MADFKKKEIINAVLIVDYNERNFLPISHESSTALLPLVNVPLLDYALESLNRSGVENVYVYAGMFLSEIKEHIKRRIQSFCSWSVKMEVDVLGGEDCRCLGDALRDLDARSCMQGDFILMSADTITNCNLALILAEHKKHVKFDKGGAMTVVFKEGMTGARTSDEVMIAMDIQNNRLHFHQRLKQHKEINFKIPLEVFLNNSQVVLHHNLIDPHIAICTPSSLALFSENFDFESRDDFIRGLLINEEILDSRIYVSILKTEQYARRAGNWLSYQIVSNDVINRWVYPMVPDMGIFCLYQNYVYFRNNIYKNESSKVPRALLKENVVIQEKCTVGSGSEISFSVVGINCKIGRNCILNYAYLFDNIVIEDNCNLQYCVIGSGSRVCSDSSLSDGVVVGTKSIIPKGSKLTKILIQRNQPKNETNPKKLGKNAFIYNDEQIVHASDSEDEEIEPQKLGIPKISKLNLNNEESEYNYSTSEDEDSLRGSPIPDDSHIFLNEVIDSLARGFTEKSNPEFLILEINSSRYAYNMALTEVNFYVVRAFFMLPKFKEENVNTFAVFREIMTRLGAVMKNYIKTEDSMKDCLKAVEESCIHDESLLEIADKVVQYLYAKDVVHEDAIMDWGVNINESDALKKSVKKVLDWIEALSEESDDE